MADLYALTPNQAYEQLDFIPEFVDPTTDDPYGGAHYSHGSRYDDPNYPAAVYERPSYVRAPCDMNPIPARYPPYACAAGGHERPVDDKKAVDAVQNASIEILGHSLDRYFILSIFVILLIIGNFILTCAVALRMRSRPLGFA
jgi:hypothetical protein